MPIPSIVTANFFLKGQKVIRPSNFIPNPKVSIILPTYNGDNQDGLLTKSIQSVLNQTFSDFELIVIDDGSTDHTPAIIEKFQQQDSRILFIRHDQNSGLPALRVNEGLTFARADYIAYQFQDDLWLSEMLDILYHACIQKERPSLVYGKSLIRFQGQEIISGTPFNFSKLIENNYIANNSVLHPRSFFEESGGYDCHLDMRRFCDWDLWIRWARIYPFVFVDKIVSLVHAGLENSIGKNVEANYDIIRILNGVNKNVSLTPTHFKDYAINYSPELTYLIPSYPIPINPDSNNPEAVQSIDSKSIDSRKDKDMILVTKAHYDSSVDITLHNFKLMKDPPFFSYFVPQIQVYQSTLQLTDLFLLHRTCDIHSSQLQDLALKEGKPVVYLLDDDLLSFYELGDEFHYLRPGSLMYQAMKKQISSADFVLTYSSIISDRVKEINPRYKTMKTNILSAYLDRECNLRYENEPFKILFAGGGARKEEFEELWPAFVAFSKEKKDQVEFHFWGFDPTLFPPLSSPVYYQPFTYSYYEYLERLKSSRFHVMICPLFDKYVAKQAKCPIKYLESVAAGCIGIFSDVLPYKNVSHFESGLKTGNSIQEWQEALQISYNITNEQRKRMWQNAKNQVLYEYSTESQVKDMHASFEAAKLHSKLKGKRDQQGSPKIAYFFHSPYLGGAENHLYRHATLVAEYGFKPILCFPKRFQFTEEKLLQWAKEDGYKAHFLEFDFYTEPVLIDEQEEKEKITAIEQWLIKQNIALVHSVTFMPHVANASQRANIPHVASLYAVHPTTIHSCPIKNHVQQFHSDSEYFRNNWAKYLAREGKVIRSWVPNDFFQYGWDKLNSHYESNLNGPIKIGIVGSLQERKGQLAAIRAIGLLKYAFDIELHLYGYHHFYPEYYQQCIQAIELYNIQDRVFFHGLCDNMAFYFNQLDGLLCASTWESFPQTILEAMATGVPIITTSITGIPELIAEEKTGILIPDASPQSIAKGIAKMFMLPFEKRRSMIQNAYDLARRECSGGHVAKELFSLYLDAWLTIGGEG